MRRKTIILSIAALFVLAVWLMIPAQGAPVLAYHMVNDLDEPYSISPGEFEEQMAILNGALKSCKNIVPKNKKKQNDDHLIIQLIKNIYFWTVLLVISGGAFALGLHFGISKFDKEKSELYETTKKQEVEINSLKDNLQSQTKTIQSLRDSLTKK